MRAAREAVGDALHSVRVDEEYIVEQLSTGQSTSLRRVLGRVRLFLRILLSFLIFSTRNLNAS